MINFQPSDDLEIRYRNLPHWELGGSIYFVTFNTWNKFELNPSARQIVFDSCLFFHTRRYQVYCFVIMPDHVHLLIQPFIKEGDKYWSLASIFHSIKSYSAKQIPQVMTHIGRIWQPERYDRIVRNEDEFQGYWHYIRQNPVKANLGRSPEQYPFFWQVE